MKLTFLGAAGEVTGSCYLVDTGRLRFLIDCGRDAQRRNFAPFAFDPRDIALVLLSHAHIDHSGLLPKLIADGFSGPIYATKATCDLLGVMLPDSAYLQEREAERKNGRRRPTPLYTVEKARLSLKRLVHVDYGVPVEPEPGVRCTFHDAGHILGSAIIEIGWVKVRLRRSCCFQVISDSPGIR